MKDAKAPGFTPKEWKAANPNDNSEEVKKKEADYAEREKKLKEIEAREAAVADKERKAKDLDGREAALIEKEKKLKEIDAREAAVADKERKAKNLDGREAALAEKEKGIKDLEGKEKSLSAREQELAAKEAAQKKQADQLAAREKELARKAGQATSKPYNSSAEEAATQKKLDELKAAERDLAAREAAAAKKEQLATAKDKELKAKQAELEKKLREAVSNGASSEALLKAENDNLKLQLKLKELEKELEAAKRASTTNPGAGKPDDDAQLKRLKDENGRLKKLIAQQVLNKPTKPVQTDGVDGEYTGPKSSTTKPSGVGQAVDSSKPTANSGRPVVPPHKVGGHLNSKTGPQTSGASTEPKQPGTGGEDPELARLREENAKLKQHISSAKTPDGKPTGISAGQNDKPQSSTKPTSPAGGKQTLSKPSQTSATPKPATSAPNGTKTGAPTTPGTVGEDQELAKLREENARLKQEAADARKPAFKPAGASTTEDGVPHWSLGPPHPAGSKQTASKPGKPSASAPNGTTTSPTKSSAFNEDAELAKLREENARLKQQIADSKKSGGTSKPAGPAAAEGGVPDSWLRPARPTGGKETPSKPGKPSTGAPNGTSTTPSNSSKPNGTGNLTGTSTADGGIPDSWLRPANLTPNKQPSSKPGKPSTASPKGASNGSLSAGGKGDPKNFINGNNQPSSATGPASGKPALKPALKPGSAGSSKPASASTHPGQKTPSGLASKTPSKSGTGTSSAANGVSKEQDHMRKQYDCGHVVYPPPRKVGMRAVGYVYE